MRVGSRKWKDVLLFLLPKQKKMETKTLNPVKLNMCRTLSEKKCYGGKEQETGKSLLFRNKQKRNRGKWESFLFCQTSRGEEEYRGVVHVKIHLTKSVQFSLWRLKEGAAAAALTSLFVKDQTNTLCFSVGGV